jgi:Ca2+-binding RTX toxin-like protein
MAILTAHHAVNTRDLQELAEIGDGTQYGSTSNANSPGTPASVDYFGSGSPHYLGLHIKLISTVGDLVLVGGTNLVTMTINEVEVYASNVPTPNDPKYEIRDTSAQMTDLWADASDNGKLDTVPAEIFEGNDELNGSAFADVLFAFKGDDIIKGGTGNDEMNGGEGEDDLTGGLGADTQTGGDGADTFFYSSILESTKKTDGGDTILDFNRIEDDDIDLKAIDAKAGGADNEFKWIGKKSFHDKKGELRYKVKDGDTYVQGDTDGNGKADFIVLLEGVTKVKVSDFEL